MKISISHELNSTNAIFHNEGLAIYSLIEKGIKNGETIELSFDDLKHCSTQFLNACVGKAFVVFGSAVAKSKLKYTNHSSIFLLERKLNEVIENASNSSAYDQLLDNAMLSI